MKKTILVLFLALFLFGCVEQRDATGPAEPEVVAINGDDIMADEKVVANGSKIKVEYVGKYPGGEVFDKSEGRGPLEFTAGAGQMIPGFDEAVIGMKLNEEKTVTIPPEKAYGAEDSGQQMEIPLGQIGGDSNVQVGATLYTQSGMQGTVLEIKDGNLAVIEFKHPMAGKTLEFWIKVIAIE